LGFIHSIPEEDFDVSSATITDVGSTVLFPKSILQKLYQYAQEIERFQQDKGDFMLLIDNLITAFIYRLITIQKVIQLMLTTKKDSLSVAIQEDNNILNAPDASTEIEISTATTPKPIKDTKSTLLQACSASKCRLLKAKGIFRRDMTFAKNKNMSSGFINEALRHRKVKKIDLELLNDTSSNSILAPLLQHTSTPISLRKFRQLCQHLPTMANKRRDDHIFGAARYIANTLGIEILNNQVGNLINQPLSGLQKKQAWRIATSSRILISETFGPRTFCNSCNQLIF
jgi:hypothetical protein